MSITGRVLAFQLVLTAAVIAMALTAFLSVRAANDYLTRVQFSREQVDLVAVLAIRANRFSEQIAELLLIGEPERPDFDDARADMVAVFDALQQLHLQEIEFVEGTDEVEEEQAELVRLAELRALYREIDRAVERVLLLDQQGDRPAAIALFRLEIENRLDADFEALISDVVADERGEVAEANRVAERLSRRLMAATFVLLGSILVIAVGSGFLLARSLKRPIRALTEGAVAIEHGNLAHRIAYSRSDELGLLAKRFNAMADQLQRQRDDLVSARDNLEREVSERTRDIAEANRQLTELDQQRVGFLADISHELRTPLTVLRGEAEVTLRGASKPETEYREALTNIVTQAAAMGDLVEDLMFLARSEADEVRFDFRHVKVGAIVSQAVQDASMLAPERTFRISPANDEPGPVVRADPRRLKQALLVVLDNARRYAGPESGIDVQVGMADHRHAEIRVLDRGPGIPPEEIPHVFERFYRGSNAWDGNGSGLGLSIARWIIERHNGRIAITSVQGEGTEVRFSLPIVA